MSCGGPNFDESSGRPLCAGGRCYCPLVQRVRQLPRYAYLDDAANPYVATQRPYALFEISNDALAQVLHSEELHVDTAVQWEIRLTEKIDYRSLPFGGADSRTPFDPIEAQSGATRMIVTPHGSDQDYPGDVIAATKGSIPPGRGGMVTGQAVHVTATGVTIRLFIPSLARVLEGASTLQGPEDDPFVIVEPTISIRGVPADARRPTEWYTVGQLQGAASSLPIETGVRDMWWDAADVAGASIVQLEMAIGPRVRVSRATWTPVAGARRIFVTVGGSDNTVRLVQRGVL